MDTYQQFIAKSRYARWIEESNRREDFSESVNRYISYMIGVAKKRITSDGDLEYAISVLESCRREINNLNIMPSMRALWTAGPALDRDNVAGYNCAYTEVSGKGRELSFEHEELDQPVTIHLSDVVCFDVIFYILLCGTGMGFTVERQVINTLPKVGKPLNRRRYYRNQKNYPGVDKEELSYFTRANNTIHVADSKYGWASALRILITELYNGNFDIQWDTSSVRPKGSTLKTFGGRASGPEPLHELFDFLVSLFKRAVGRRLNSLECHEIVCKIAEIVVVGGVRRSALLGLSNLSDDRMRGAKSGDWRKTKKHLELANNSVGYTEKPDFKAFMNEWKALYESYSGERGIFYRGSAKKQVLRNGRRDTEWDFGTNPCSEIILRPDEFCNLTEVVIRRDDGIANLRRKVFLATVLGTIQSTLTDFVYLPESWKKNCEEERLLGVSMTGIMDNPVMSGQLQTAEVQGFGGRLTLSQVLTELRELAIETNKEWAKMLGINQSAAITCVKPSGTVSQLVDSASGIHPRYSPYYIRRVRIDDKDPIGRLLIDKGVPYNTDGHNLVFEFPKEAPEGAVTAKDFLGIKQLQLWKLYQDYWCEHKPSITVYYRDQDFFEIGQWVYNNFEDVSGISFLPYDDHVYPLAPYEPISKEVYDELVAAMPGEINWDDLSQYENADQTTGGREFACTGNSCELVDIGESDG